MIYNFFPFRSDKNLGKAYNDYCRIVPSTSDWILLKDYDVMFLDPRDLVNIERAVEHAPKDAGILTVYTNRVGRQEQCYPGAFEDKDLISHRKRAAEIASKSISFKPINKIISGMVMMFSKSSWSSVGGFPEDKKCLTVDNEFSRRIMANGKKIYLIENVYALHYYRLLEGRKFKEHLK